MTGVAFCRGLSFERLCVGRTRWDLAGRRDRALDVSTLHHRAGPRSTAAISWNIAMGTSYDLRRRLLALCRKRPALPMALDGDGGRHDRERRLPLDRTTVMA